MEKFEKLDCVQDYYKAMNAVHRGDNKSAEDFLKIAISTLGFEINMSTDKELIDFLGKKLRHARETLKEVKYINQQFSKTTEKTI